MQLKIEREALKKETDAASKQRLEAIEDEIDELQVASDEMTARWKSEKDKVGSAAQVREALERLRAELAVVQRQGNFERAGQIQYGEIPQLEKRLAEEESKSSDPKDNPLTPEVVDAEQIARGDRRTVTRPSGQSDTGRSGRKRRSCGLSAPPERIADAIRDCLEHGRFERWYPRSIAPLQLFKMITPRAFIRSLARFDRRADRKQEPGR